MSTARDVTQEAPGVLARWPEARVVIEEFRNKYGQRRPHSELGYQSPARYAANLYPSLAPVTTIVPGSDRPR